MKIEKGAEKSHIAHEKHLTDLVHEKDKRFLTMRNKDCVAYKLNTITLDVLKPFLLEENSWLTVGDYLGFEAKYFQEHNQKVIASDISDAFLREAKKEGLIENYSKENVEGLSFGEGEIDYVSCREAFHHFPRAYLGAYEMIRVARKAAIIIEPIDILSKSALLLNIKNIADIFSPYLINKLWKNRFSWEKVGNYVFKISEREVEKMAMGIGLPCIAFKNMNLNLKVKKDMNEVPTNQKLLNKYNRKTKFRNLLSMLRIVPYNTLISVIFKEMPTEQVLSDMKKEGYTIIKLPKNPYLN